MKSVTLPGLLRPAPDVEKLTHWAYRECQAEARWPWYRSRVPMFWIAHARPSVN